MDEEIQKEVEESVSEETKHEPHTHAKQRIIIGLGAVLVVLLAIFFIWPRWGDTIKEKCFGDGGVCEFEVPQEIQN